MTWEMTSTAQAATSVVQKIGQDLRGAGLGDEAGSALVGNALSSREKNPH
jgi:hypothetical protein